VHYKGYKQQTSQAKKKKQTKGKTMTGIKIAGQNIAEELRKLKEMDKNTAVEARKADRKRAWNEQETKRKELAERKSAQMKINMEKLRRKVEEGKKSGKPIEQLIAEGAYEEDQRLKARGINPRVW
jgi:hypothetical protein